MALPPGHPWQAHSNPITEAATGIGQGEEEGARKTAVTVCSTWAPRPGAAPHHTWACQPCSAPLACQPCNAPTPQPAPGAALCLAAPAEPGKPPGCCPGAPWSLHSNSGSCLCGHQSGGAGDSRGSRRAASTRNTCRDGWLRLEPGGRLQLAAATPGSPAAWLPGKAAVPP